MMQRRALLLAALPLGARASEAPPEVRTDWPAPGTPRPQGQGRLRFLGLAVYDIVLWSAGPLASEALERTPLALSITYLRALSGERIAERSLKEMQRGGPIAEADAARWLAAMRGLFPDVAEGDRITGVHVPGRGARFHLNGRLLGELAEPRFAALFFGIWLAPWTSEPGLRQQLLGATG